MESKMRKIKTTSLSNNSQIKSNPITGTWGKISYLLKKVYKKSINNSVERFIPDTKYHLNQYIESKYLRENFKGYHYVSLKSIIVSYFDYYAFFWMASLKVVVPNNVLSVPKLKIAHTSYSPIQLHMKFLKILINNLRTLFF